jgi:hypothetical protein
MFSIKALALKIHFILIIGLLYSCTNKTETKPLLLSNNSSESAPTIITDTLFVNAAHIKIQVQGGKGLYNGELFTGYATKSYENGQLSEKIFYLNGKKEGVAIYWFENGMVWKTNEFANNKLNGYWTAYFKNGKKSFVKNYLNNKLNGVQEMWYNNGKPFKRLNYVNGKEVGLQQGWTSTGKFFANYEVIDGRIFGLKRMDLCFGLKDENTQINVKQ